MRVEPHSHTKALVPRPAAEVVVHQRTGVHATAQEAGRLALPLASEKSSAEIAAVPRVSRYGSSMEIVHERSFDPGQGDWELPESHVPRNPYRRIEKPCPRFVSVYA